MSTIRNLDSHVAALLDQPYTSADQGGEEDEDFLIDQLDNDDALDAFREQRLQQLHSEVTRAKQLRDSEHGAYTQVKDEKALIDITTSTKLCVVHFFQPDFNRCRIMHSHLEALAPKHLDTRFICMNVVNAPFLVTKLKVQVLPCLLAFVDGIGVDRVVGFEGLGHGDSFTTMQLEARLLRAGVLLRSKITSNDGLYAQQYAVEKSKHARDEEDDWD